jgi:hypothetical protein
MVQTSTGAKSNPWITYMKECRTNYNVAKATSVLENVEPTLPKVETTNRSQIKKAPKTIKKVLKPAVS